MHRAALVSLLALVAVPRDGWAQGGVPIGPEFRANGIASYSYAYGALAADAFGGFVVAWNFWSPVQSSVYASRLALYDPPQGAEFRVNTDTSAGHGYPAVAQAPTGAFVIVWLVTHDSGARPRTSPVCPLTRNRHAFPR